MKVLSVFLEILPAILLMIGAGLISLGGWMIYPPLGVVLAGCWLVAIAIMMVRGDSDA